MYPFQHPLSLFPIFIISIRFNLNFLYEDSLWVYLLIFRLFSFHSPIRNPKSTILLA
jgi:hypothetical protein